MSYSIHADLLTEQKKAAYQPSLSLSIQDNGLPKPSLLYSNLLNYAPNVGNTASVSVSSSVVVRAHVASGNVVEVQRVTAVSPQSAFESWTAIRSTANSPALFYTGTYVVLVYQDTSTKTVYWRRSSDGGVTWSSESSIWTPAYFFNNFYNVGVSGGSTKSALFYSDFYSGGTSIYCRRYNDTTNTWGTEQSFAAGGSVLGMAAVYESGDIYRVVMSIQSYVSWATSVIVSQQFTYPSTWGTARIVRSVQGGNIDDAPYVLSYLNLAKINSAYWLSFVREMYASPGDLFGSSMVLCYSDDGEYFSEGLTFEGLSAAEHDRYQPFTWGSGSIPYLVSNRRVYSSYQPGTITLNESDIFSYELDWNGAEGTISLVLDDLDGAIGSLENNQLGSEIVLSRGAICSGTSRQVTSETFIVSRFGRTGDLMRVLVDGFNYYRLLSLWHAWDSHYFTAITLSNLIESIAALAGIHSVETDGNAVFSLVVGSFSIQPNQSGESALNALMAQYQFVARMNESGALYCFVLSSAPSSIYTFSSADHPFFFAEDSIDRVMPEVTHVVIVGDGVGAESHATAVQGETGRQFTQRITRRYITATADAAGVANSVITKVNQSINRAAMVSLPAFHLQPFDVVSLRSVDRYITRLKESYDVHRGDARVIEQRISLAEISAGVGQGGALPGSLIERAQSATRRGTIVSFNSATWVADVRIEGGTATLPLPCGQWLSSSLFTAGAAVAVLLFDESNPTDGLVVGPYGATSPVMIDQRISYKSSDQNNIGTSFADVTGVEFSVEANKAYSFEFVLLCTADATTTGIDVAVNGPASPTAIYYTQAYWTGAAAQAFAGATAYDNNPASTGSNGTAARAFVVKGVLRNGSNAGTLIARAKREAVGSGPNVLAGSYGLIQALD